jgi:GT2 family glycosyltransferase/ubiquinone/menaquinone biosynthesis C-methylase UbiE
VVHLSACVITKNEEKNLPRWINSMQKIVDEMIIVDTGSTDQTRKIAKAAGAKVYDFVWCNDFAAAKNFAIEKASGDWILFLDADEYFTAETIKYVPEYLFKVQDNKNIDAFLCRLVNIDADGDDRVISVGSNLRIFRNDEALRFQGQIHEFLVRLGGPLRLAHLEAKTEIYHTGYSTKIVKGKLERNLMILQEDIEKNGEKPWHYAYLADCYYGLKEYDKAICYAKRSIEAKVISLGQETNIYRRLIDATVLGGKEEKEIMAVIELALGKFPRNPEFIWNKGEILFQQKDYVSAKKYLLKARHLYKNQKEKEQEGAFSGQINLLYCTLGKVAVIEGDTLQALEYYTRSLMEYKYNEFALTGLYQILRKQDPVDGIALLQSIYNTTKRDLEFVNKILKSYSMDKIYLYYTQILQNQYKISTEDVSIAGFLVAGKVDKAVNCAMEKIKDIYMFIVMTVVLSYDEQKYQTAKVLLPSLYQSVLDKSLGKATELSEEAYKVYQIIQHKLGRSKGLEAQAGRFTSMIIPVYNHLSDTKQCIETIRLFTKAEKYEIIVINNGSIDGTAEWLKQQPDIKVISNDENEGFVKACNQGIDLARGNEILLLQNDTIVTNNWLKNMREALYSNPIIGAVGPLSYGVNALQRPEIIEDYSNFIQMEDVAAKIAAEATQRWEQVLSLDAFCILLKREAVAAAGLLDEQFSPHYYEDIDYAFRLIKAGYRLLVSKEVFVHHTGGGTFKEFGAKRQEIYDANFIKFKHKWGFSPHYSCGIRQDLLSIMDLQKQGLTILDVGCACGGNLMRIKEENPSADVYGIELNEGSAAIANCFGDISNCNIEQEDSLKWQIKFDYIIMGDVLEHLYNPLQTLKNLKKFLKTDGCIVASIPNVMHISVITDLLQGNWTYEDAGILDRTHLRFFTKKEIEKMINEAGLQLLKIVYHSVGLSKQQEKMKEQLQQLTGIIKDKTEFDAYQWIVLAQNKIITEEKEECMEMDKETQKLLKVQME